MAVTWRPGFWSLTLGELFNPSVPQSFNLCQMSMRASAPPGSVRIRPGGDGALHARESPSNALVWLVGIVTSSLLGLGQEACGRVRVTHSGLSCPSVSEGQSPLQPPCLFFFFQEENPRPTIHCPVFCSLAGETVKLVSNCSDWEHRHQLFSHWLIRTVFSFNF